MESLEQAKDLRTVASVSAVVAVAVSANYFNNKINQLETEVKEIQKHLATIIPNADPHTKPQLEQVIQAIRILDNRLVQTQKNVQTLAGSDYDLSSGKRSYRRLTPSKKPKNHKYERLTPSTKPKSSLLVSIESTYANSSEEDDFLETSTDEEDIAAMMED